MSANAVKESEAVRAAEAWLALVDTGRYGEAWDHASHLLRGAVERDDLAASLAGVRRPLGAVEQRTRRSATYATELPAAPDGEYVVIQLETRFGNKERAVETITPALEADGIWRVSGYYIK